MRLAILLACHVKASACVWSLQRRLLLRGATRRCVTVSNYQNEASAGKIAGNAQRRKLTEPRIAIRRGSSSNREGFTRAKLRKFRSFSSQRSPAPVRRSLARLAISRASNRRCFSLQRKSFAVLISLNFFGQLEIQSLFWKNSSQTSLSTCFQIFF